MGLETQGTIPVWIGKFAHVEGSTAYQEVIGTTATPIVPATFGAEPNALLVQATGGNIYWRMDGNPATPASFLLKKDDPPVLFPWVYGTSVYSFIGADANARLIIQPVTVH